MQAWRDEFKRYQPAYLVLLISLVPALVLLANLLSLRNQQVRSTFDEEVQRVRGDLQKQLITAIQPVLTTAGFFAANPGATLSDWTQFSSQSGLAGRFGETNQPLLDVGVIWRTRSSDHETTFQRLRGQGFTFIHQDHRPVGDDRFISILLENFEGRQPLDTVWDSSVESEIRLAMEVARDTGRPAATGVVGLYHLGRQTRVAGIVVLTPIYSGGGVAEVAVRRNRLAGFAYGSLLSQSLWNAGYPAGQKALVSWSLLEPAVSGGRPLASVQAVAQAEFKPALLHAEVLPLLGKPWELKVSSLPALERSPQGALPWVVFLAGLTVSGSLFMIARAQVRARYVAEELAQGTKRAEVAILREKQFSEAILNDLPGLFVLFDEQGRLVRWNRYVEQLTGLGSHELQQLRGRDLFGWSESGGGDDQLAEVFRKGHTQVEIRLRAKEGTPVPYFFSGYRFQSAEKAFCIGIGLDLSEREKAQAEIQSAHRLTRQVMDSAQQGVVVLDHTLRVVVWNPFMERITGANSAQINGKEPLDFFPVLREFGVEKSLRRALEGEASESAPFEVRFIQHASPLWLVCTYAPLRGAEGDVVGVLMMVRDVGQSRRAEFAIEGQNKILERSLRGEDMGTIGRAICQYVTDSTSGIACMMSLVVSPAGVPSHFHSGSIPDSVRKRLESSACVMLGPLTAVPDDFRDPLKDWPGSETKSLALGLGFRIFSPRLIRSGEGRLLGMLCLVSRESGVAEAEVSQFVEAAARLASVTALSAESAQKAGLFVTLAEKSTDLVGFAEIGGRVLYLNNAGRELVGSSAESGTSQPSYLDLFDVRDRKKIESEILPRVISEGQAGFQTLLTDLRGGPSIPVECTTFVLQQPHDAGTRFVAIVARDIRERIKVELEREGIARKLVETQKFESLGVLAGGIAHDFNNLLAGILGSANLARMELSSTSAVQPLLAQIEESSKRAAGLCSQLLAYAGKGRFIIEPLDISALVQDSSSLLRHSIDPSCELRLELARDLPFIEADAQQFRQTLVNLVVNAAESLAGQPGAIVVTTRIVQVEQRHLLRASTGSDLPTGPYVALEVRDTGSGIDPSMIDRIFDPFFTTKFPGRGLGLASVLGIVRSHKGILRVESTPGKGSVFQILMPPSLGSHEQSRAKSDTSFFVSQRPPTSTSNTVLVADDEDYVREITSRLLEAWGCSVKRVSNGREAVDCFKQNPNCASAVLIDLAMPEMDGATACREIHKINPKVPVVVMSGFSAAEVATYFDGETVASFLQKPFTADRLYEVVRRLVKCEKNLGGNQS